MAYKVERADGVIRDFDLIEDYLVRVYLDVGEDLNHAVTRAHARIRDAVTYMRTFRNHPYRGTLLKHIQSDLRTVTNLNFIFYFEIDEARGRVLILAVFFGGMDHRRQILDRLRQGRGEE